MSTNPRSGWSAPNLAGKTAAGLNDYLSDEKVLKTSLLRDMKGNIHPMVSDSFSGKAAFVIKSDIELEEYKNTKSIADLKWTMREVYKKKKAVASEEA